MTSLQQTCGFQHLCDACPSLKRSTGEDNLQSQRPEMCVDGRETEQEGPELKLYDTVIKHAGLVCACVCVCAAVNTVRATSMRVCVCVCQGVPTGGIYS